MTLSEYLRRPGAKAELSRMLGVTKARVSQLRKSEQWPPELALKAEAATDGILDASTLSPVVAQARAA